MVVRSYTREDSWAKIHTVKGYQNSNFPNYKDECEYLLLTSTKSTATSRLLLSLLCTLTKTQKRHHIEAKTTQHLLPWYLITRLAPLRA